MPASPVEVPPQVQVQPQAPVQAQIHDPQRARHVRRVLYVTLFLNLLVAASKGFYGAVSGSLAVVSDALHSLVDAASNIVALLVMGRSAEPPDEGHPYGHRKMEIIAASVIGVAVGFVALRFAWEALGALVRGPSPPATSLVGFLLIGGTWAVNVFVAIYEARRARALKSPLLLADAAHTASDVVVTAVVLVSFAASHLGLRWADPVGALVVVVVVGRVAWHLVVRNLDVLIDGAVVDAALVRAVAERHPSVLHCHRVRSRGVEGAAHVDLHLLLDGDLPLRQAHDIAHEVEDAIKAGVPGVIDVVIHTEPEESRPEDL